MRGVIVSETQASDAPQHGTDERHFCPVRPGDTDLVVVAAAPPGLEFVVLVGVTLVTNADFDALDRILATFQTFGDVPGRR